ncbi:allophanate hydrolase [Yeosuana aromativorans]|uniref:Allophanate hydrolase n=1 Tax=Yeosuana aromativorans TaxID=288019 RepID=A0A8J3FEY2_9FLAO|nr:5-oxoprolinase subunit PxpB [Yeosuana aromativorans]GGK15881.1 allophanate hydrolase [Yeosuana aromativorans]
MGFELTYKPFGERSILVEWPSVINEQILKDIIGFKTAIKEKNVKSIVEIKSAYNSLLITYNSICRNFENEVKILKNIYELSKKNNDRMSVLWKIPVCYDDCFGIDLDAISEEKKLSKKDIIKIHSQAVYTVYFIGFLPGFLYLGGLDERLHVDRKQTPRLTIEKGTVAIGGQQTGVYPNESPGGWNVIGNTPISFFDVTKEEPCFANPGDQIIFNPITLEEYNHVKILVEAGVYQMESEVIDG